MKNKFTKIAICEIEWDTEQLDTKTGDWVRPSAARLHLPDQITVELAELGLTYEELQCSDTDSIQDNNDAIEQYLYNEYGYHTYGFGWEER